MELHEVSRANQLDNVAVQLELLLNHSDCLKEYLLSAHLSTALEHARSRIGDEHEAQLLRH